MERTLAEEGLSFARCGYHVTPSGKTSVARHHAPYAASFLSFERALFRARDGDLSGAEDIPEVWMDGTVGFRACCEVLLSDIAPRAMIERVMAHFEEGRGLADQHHWVRALARCVPLRRVPALLEGLSDLVAAGTPDLDLAALRLNQMFGGPVSDATPLRASTFPRYQAAVLAACNTATSHFGADTIVLRHGAPLHPERCALLLLDRIDTADASFARDIRWDLEALTGLDLSGFFREGRLDRDATRAWLIAFIESDAPSRFTPGARYFFGREITD